MTRKELIAQIKSKDYESKVKSVVDLLTSHGEVDAVTLIISLYGDLDNLMKAGKNVAASNQYFEDEHLNEAFNDFVAMRIKIKKPLTANAIGRSMSKLEKLSGGNVDTMIKILEQSVDNCWAGLFPLHEDSSSNFKANRQNPQCSQLDAILGSITND